MLLLVLYYCNIPKAKDMPAMWHGVAVMRPCARCMVTADDVISGEIASERSVMETKMIRSRFLKLPKNSTGRELPGWK